MLVLRRSDLLNGVHHEPALVDGVLRSIGALVRRLTEQATDLVFQDVQTRVAKLLVNLAEQDGVTHDRAVVLDLSLSQGDLAEMAFRGRALTRRFTGRPDVDGSPSTVATSR